MAKKLFVGGLSFGTTEEKLMEDFSRAGKLLSAVIIKDRATGRSKGFGFIEYEDAESANQAIEMYNNQEYDGRTIVVKEALPRPEKPNFNRNNYQSRKY